VASVASDRFDVLFLTTEWPSEEKPTDGIFIREHAAAVAAAGCNVGVVHLARAPSRRGLFDVARLRSEEIPTWRVRYRRFPRPLSYAAFALGALAGVRRARRSGLEPRVVHCHSFLSCLVGLAVGRVLRVPVLYTEHWTIFVPENPRRLGRWQRAVARLALSQASVVLPVSEDLREALTDLAPAANMHVVPNAVDEQVFHPAHDLPARNGRSPRLLTVGLLDTERKGVDVLIRALAGVAERGAPFHLDVIGEGANRQAYETLAEKLGIGDRVTWHGWQPKDAVADAMRDADLFVLGSRYENNPCVVIEAMASGLPVVATNVGGVDEVVDATSGSLAAPLDPDDLAAKVEDTLQRLDSFDREEIARTAVSRYGRETIGRELAAIYASCTARS
jgi:L-malate glycosyltransferase